MVYVLDQAHLATDPNTEKTRNPDRSRRVFELWSRLFHKALFNQPLDHFEFLSDEALLSKYLPTIDLLMDQTNADTGRVTVDMRRKMAQSTVDGVRLIGSLHLLIHGDRKTDSKIISTAVAAVKHALQAESRSNESYTLAGATFRSLCRYANRSESSKEFVPIAVAIVLDEASFTRRSIDDYRSMMDMESRGEYEHFEGAVDYLKIALTAENQQNVVDSKLAPFLERQFLSISRLVHDEVKHGNGDDRIRAVLDITHEIMEATGKLSPRMTTVIEKLYGCDESTLQKVNLWFCRKRWVELNDPERHLLLRAIWTFKTSHRKEPEGQVTVSLRVNFRDYRFVGIERNCGTPEGIFKDMEEQRFYVDLSNQEIRLKSGDKVEMTVEHVGNGRKVEWGVSVGGLLQIQGPVDSFDLGFSEDVLFEDQKIRGTEKLRITLSGTMR